MDDCLLALLAKRLSISETQLKTSYSEALKEYSTTKEYSISSKKNHCMYRFVAGENSGKICGLLPKNSNVEATLELEGKFYCRPHFRTITEKTRKSQTLKLVGLKNPVHLVDEKFETERMGDYEVLKDTMLIVDRTKNCCSGKLVDNQPTTTITRQDEIILNEKKIPYYRCTVEEEEDVTIDNSEEIQLDDILG
jgi:hypothetical protein